MNINTKKYYYIELVGGGVPEEIEKMLEEKFRLPTEAELGNFESIADAISHMASQNLCLAASKYGYYLAAEKLKEQEQEIERLKAENERLRGENDVIIARLKENMVRFYYFINNRFIPMLEKEHKYPVNFLRYGQYGERIPQVTIEEIVKEYFESITPSPTTKK